MKSRRAVIFAIVTGLLGARPALGAAPAGAAATCDRIAVEAAPEVSARWPELAASVRAALAERDDVDACARVALGPGGGGGGAPAGMVVEVRLADGRAASRVVRRPEDVLPALEGLLLVPERPQPAAIVAAATATVAAAAAAPPAPAPAMRIELSVGTGARLGDGQPGFDLGARSLIELGGWLAGFEGRLAAYQSAADVPIGGVELAALGGRRLRAGTLALDLLAGAGLALQVGSRSVKQVGSPEPAVTTTTSRFAPRLLAGARVHFRALSTLRPFVGVDGDLGLSGGDAGSAGSTGPQNGLAPMPGWSAGLMVGATVATR